MAFPIICLLSTKVSGYFQDDNTADKSKEEVSLDTSDSSSISPITLFRNVDMEPFTLIVTIMATIHYNSNYHYLSDSDPAGSLPYLLVGVLFPTSRPIGNAK